MFGHNFFAAKGLFTYSKYVFQGRYFCTHVTNEKGATMVRKRNVRLQRSSFKDKFTSSTVNLQERLSHIRQSVTKKLSGPEVKKLDIPKNQEKTVALQDYEKHRYNLRKDKSTEDDLLPTTENPNKLINFPTITCGPVLPFRNLNSTENIALRSKLLNTRTTKSLNVEEFSKNIVNNVIFKSASDKDSNSNILGKKEHVIAVEKDIEDLKKLNEKRESSYNVRLQNLEKFIHKKTENVRNELRNNKLHYTMENSLFKNIKPISNILQEKIRSTTRDGHSSSNCSTTSSDTDLLDVEPVRKKTGNKSDSTSFLDTSCDIDSTSFDLDLKFIENKMKNLNINDHLDSISQNRRKNSQNFVNEDSFVNQINIVSDRKILKARRKCQQKRLFSTDRSCDAVSGVNNEQPLESIPVNGTEHKVGKLVIEEDSNLKDKSSDLTKDVNLKKPLSRNDLRRKLNRLRSSSDEHVIKTTVSNIKEESLECKHIKVESKLEVVQLYEKFPFPKNILDSYYQFLSRELKDKSLKVEPLYKSNLSKQGGKWTCMYHLKWPENCKVSARGSTKKEASSVAALRCLMFLSECGKISPDGLPLIYSKEEVKKLTENKQAELIFDDKIIEKMQNIVHIFSNKMSPFLSKVDYDNWKDQGNNMLGEETDPVDFVRSKTPIYLGMQHYLAKEKVELPISKLKESFIDLIQNNNCVIVQGEPGCGKSSRVPQYVLEAWVKGAASKDQLCRIAVTQPRRIAAISLATRVASERNEEVGSIVGYQVRLKSGFQPKTGRILYCTTGILLRHLQTDPNLTKFSHVILDEAHERDVNTDLLITLMKNALNKNDNLKVVVMSATIDADKFSEYFGGAPVFSVPGFAYPVTKRYLDSCKLDVSKTLKMCNGDILQVVHKDVAEVIGYINKNKPEGAILTFLPGWEDLVKVQNLIPVRDDVVVYLVHSKLKDSEQYKIFSRPPPGVRKIILATNIAETSITIDDVVYVVDSGIQKDQIFDNDKGINVIDMEWISKASANQRAGRAGRCSPGEAYHLYTEERFSKFPDYSSPKILNSSLTKVVLDAKMYTNNMAACDFMNSLITPPETIAVERAVDELKQLDLLDEREKLTPLGRTLVNFQLEPNLAKVMVNAVVFKCTTPIVDIVTLFSSETGLFGSLSLTGKDHIKNVKSRFCKSSDHLALMRVYEKWLEIFEETDPYEANRFCRDTNLVPFKLEFVKQLKDIHFGYLYNGLYESLPISEDFSDNDEFVKALLYSGTGTVLQHRNWDIVKNRLKHNTNVLVTRNNQKATIASESVNYKRSKFPSDFLVYINETRSNIRRTTIVRECSLIPPVSVLLFSNKKLEILKADIKGDNLRDDLVIVGIKNTKLRFLCDKQQANVIISCKEAIDESYKYLIHQLTYAGEQIPEFLEHWDTVLRNLGDILEEFKIE